MSEKVFGDDFRSVYYEIRNALAEIGRQEPGTEDAFAWLDKVLEYNVNNGENTRGRLVATSFQALVKSPQESDVKIAYVLGWCVEMDGIGILSINDAVFIEAAMYYIIRQYIADKTYYGDILELFREATLHKIIGQRIELNMYSNGLLDWSSFTLSAYESIAVYKQAFYSTYLPAACAMYMAGITDEESHSEAKQVLLEIGQLMQIQEDYNKCFGEDCSPEGWACRNQDKTCTWMTAQARELASDKQKEELQAYYCEESDLALTQIRDVYKCLGLQTAYRLLKAERLHKIAQMIRSCKGRKRESLFVSMLENLLTDKDAELCIL